MLFQTLDDKKECVGIYHDGSLLFNEELPTDISRTWSYSSFLENRDIQYAKIYCGGKTLEEVCPEALKPRLERLEKRFKAYIKSFITSQISLNENCFYDLVPKGFLLEWCHVKDLVCKHVFETYEKPANYDYTLDLIRVIEEIRHNRLIIDKKEVSLYRAKHRKFSKKLNELSPYCKFNVWGTKTGRLTTMPKSFPILTLDKEFRSVLKPKNDYFVELDFNAAELRTLLSLQGRTQPEGDIHEWNIENIFNGQLTRDQAKKRIFAWLYNPESYDPLCEHAYGRESVVQKYFTQGQVTTFWNKVIRVSYTH